MESHFNEKLRFILAMNGRVFHDDKSRFSWLQVEIFLMTGLELLIASPKIPEHEESFYLSSFYEQLPDYYSHLLTLST